MHENKRKYGRHILKFGAASAENMRNAMIWRNCTDTETVLVVLTSSSM
jgi:hypothetical protein